MNATAHRVASGLGVLALIASTAVLLSSCSSAQSRQLQTIKIDGSSTVYPITNAIAADFPATQANKQGSNLVKVTVDVSGTSGGFRKFCEGTADISNASRPIIKDEMALCNRNNVRYYELPIAFDALTVVVNFKSAQDKPQVRDFVEFYLNKAPTSVSSVVYIPLPEEAYHLNFVHFHAGKVGTVFAGNEQLNLTLGELLRKQATF